MAVSGLMTIPAGLAERSAAKLLFERLPDRLFAPLASANRHQYWALLCRLHVKRFGPDAPLPPSHGFAVREIMQDIEDELVTQDLWENEDGSTPDTPIGIRANAVFNRLMESGWFRLERHGMEKRFVSKNRGRVLVRVICQVHDRARFLSCQTFGSRRLFSW